MHIRTARLLLRDLFTSDADRISLLAGDFEVASMTGTIPHPYSEEMAAEWIADVHAGKEGVVAAIEADGSLVGCVGYRPLGPRHAELGYWIGHPFWNRGYATEAARALLRHAFESGQFDHLTIGHFHDNPASARVIAKLGAIAAGEELRPCAARGDQARCLVYRIPREKPATACGDAMSALERHA